MTTHIGKVTIKVFRVTRGNKREPKETWRWNDGVQNAINEKKKCYKCLHHNKSDENIQKYKEAKRKRKESCEQSKGEYDVYKMAKLQERKTKDFN
jgi:hypothetical protein